MAYWDLKHCHDSRSLGPPWSSAAALVIGLLLMATSAWGHSFPDRSEPRVGWTVNKPAQVRIWFDVPLEPIFSTIKVVDANGQQVDKQDGRVNPTDHTLLEVSLPALPPGKYRVFWNVISIDTHRTEGDYPFTISSSP